MSWRTLIDLTVEHSFRCFQVSYSCMIPSSCKITKMPIVKYFISSQLQLPFPPPKRYRFNSFALSKFLSDCPYVYGSNNNYPQLTVLPTPTVIWITQSRAKRQGSQRVDWRAKRSLCTVKLKLKCCSYVISLRVFV